MLQPSQIEDVSVRYADEITEVREFFATAGIAVGMPQALAQVVTRLRDDRGFHRDLTSHVWVMLHRRGAAVRYGDTLGVLAIAATDKQQAAQADELVAHDLLRFVMEAHDLLNPSGHSVAPAEAKPVAPVIPIRPVREVAEPPLEVPEPVVEPVSVADSKHVEVASTTSPMLMPALVRSAPVAEEPAHPALDTSIRLSRMDAALAEEPEQRGKGLLWLALVAVLLLASVAGWWMYRRQAGEGTAATPAPVVEGTSVAPVEPAPAVAVVPEHPVAAAPVARLSASPKSVHRTHVVEAPHARPQQHKPELVPSYPAPAPAAVAKSAAPSPVAPQTNAANTPRPASGAAAAAPIVRPALAAKPGPAIVSSNVLSKQLDRPGLTKEQEAEYDASGRRYPRLLRRTSAGSDDVQLAMNTVPTTSGMANNTPSTGSAVAGVVRPTSLGVMASNLVYSPAASYPAAASAAHVTGSVKVEAVVDTSGNVAAARVISGPTQLRDAALMAVQQWRYKPYVLGGKARTFTTQALMEFELP